MLWVVAYDVRDNRRRRRVEKVLRGYGFRVQYSVFECRIGKTKLGQLKQELCKQTKPEDSLLFYGLCEACEPKVIAVPERDPFDSDDDTVVL